MSDLDVALRLRLLNLLSGPAGAAQRDLAKIGDTARRLNGTVAGGALAGSLRQVGGAATGAAAGLAAAQGRLSQFRAAGAETAAQLGVLPVMMGRFGLIAGGTALGVLASAAALKGATKTAIGFETALAEVKKAVDLTPAQFAALRDTILQTSRATGIVKEQIAALVAQAGFAGRPAEDLARFATFAAKAAVAFQMSAEDTGDALAKLANVFDLTQDGVEDLANAINTLGDSTAAKERDIVEFLKVAGPAAKSFQMTGAQAAAFGSTLLSLGVAPGVAATGFNALAQKLMTARQQGKGFQEGLKEIGLTGQKVSDLLRRGPVQAIEEVMRRIRSLEPEARAGVLMKLFGLEYGDDVQRMADNVDKLAKAFDLVADAGKRAGSVENTFKIFDETAQAKIDRMTAGFSALGERIGRVFSPAVGATAEAIANVLDRLLRMGETAPAGGGAPKDPLTGRRLGVEPEPAVDPKQQAKDLRELELLRLRAMRTRERVDNPGWLQRLFGTDADKRELEDVERRIREMEGKLGAAARQSMQGVTEAISAEGARAAAEAGRIAEEIKRKFDFTVSPTISPRLGPVPGGAGGATAPKPQSHRAPAVGGPAQREARRPLVIQQAHFHGVQDAAALHRELARYEDRAVRQARDGALHDLGRLT